MTREEAIIILTNTAFLLRDGTRYMKLEHEKQFREAYEMAIKALEQPEIIRCKNCRKHNVKVGIDEDFNVVWKEDACPLEYIDGDFYCGFAKRREE